MIGTPRQKAQLALYTTSIVLATAGLAGRLWARRITRTKWQLNDWFMIFAYISALGLVIASNIAVTQGEMGAHVSEVPPQKLKDIAPLNYKMIIILPPLLASSSFLAKMSITHFYITLFPHTRLKRICQFQLLLLALCWIGSIVPGFFVCQPLSYIWDHVKMDAVSNVRTGASIGSGVGISARGESSGGGGGGGGGGGSENGSASGRVGRGEGGKCFDVQNFWLGTSVVALAFDISCVVLPIPVFWGLRTTWKRKVRLIVLFGLGGFICILSTLRIVYDERISFTDLPYTAAPAIMFTVPEPCLGIVAGCIPISVPLFKRIAGRWRGKKRKKNIAMGKNTSSPSAYMYYRKGYSGMRSGSFRSQNLNRSMSKPLPPLPDKGREEERWWKTRMGKVCEETEMRDIGGNGRGGWPKERTSLPGLASDRLSVDWARESRSEEGRDTSGITVLSEVHVESRTIGRCSACGSNCEDCGLDAKVRKDGNETIIEARDCFDV